MELILLEKVKNLGNLGDSLSASQENDFLKRNQAELKMVFDMLEETFGYKKFLLIGICSSAVDAHHAAVSDPRVAGMVSVDTFVFPTPEFRRRYMMERIFKLRSWKRLAVRKYREWSGAMEKIQLDRSSPSIGSTRTMNWINWMVLSKSPVIDGADAVRTTRR